MQTPIRTPEVHAAEYDPSTGAAILLLQDCSHMYPIPNDHVGWVEQAAKITDTAARLHAHWWNREAELSGFECVMQPDEDSWRSLARRMGSAWRTWLGSRWADRVPDGLAPLCESLPRRAESFLTRDWPTTSLTLCHGDMHAGNMLHDPDDPQDPIVVFDWTSYRLGRGAHDLAYLLSQLPADFRREAEREMLPRYGDALEANGVRYSMEDIWLDYRFGCLVNMILMLPMVLELDLPGQERLIDRLCTAVLDHDAQRLMEHRR